jgi:hypothetical protein
VKGNSGVWGKEVIGCTGNKENLKTNARKGYDSKGRFAEGEG